MKTAALLVCARRIATLSAVVALMMISGCAALKHASPDLDDDAPTSTSSVTSRGASTASNTTSSNVRAFADVIRDAKRNEGFLTLWQRDDKVWIELKPSDFNTPFFLSPKNKTGIGEGPLFGGLMGDELLIEFRRVHQQVQMIARNSQFVAKPDTPAARAVSAAFSPSLLASTGVASQPHPDTKSILIEANPLFVNDMLGTGAVLQRTYRQGYSLDTRNSAITALRTSSDLVVIEVMSHFATPAINTGSGSQSVPSSLPDPRSLFMTFHYSLAKLPDQAMRPRKADGRVGFFSTAINDFSDDLARSPRQRFVNRWRLEKKDSNAVLSEPVRPITFWLDRTIPEKYRDAISAGVLEWNKAFEKIGFKNALRVEIQPDDAPWDTLDFGRASIRWMTNSAASFGAIGPSHVDPRTGEILDADIAIESLSSRNLRSLRAQILGASAMVDSAQVHRELAHTHGAKALGFCSYGEHAAEQLGYALDVLQARDEVDPESPAAEQFIFDYLKDTTMHEVGHALGLRHNFRSSRIYSDKQLSSREFTQEHGLTGSVMEYAPINLAPPGVDQQKFGTPFNSTLGPYDYWAIEYAYKPLAPEQELDALAAIANRSAEPQLAYGTDEDNFLGVDPESLQFDLGSDVVAFAQRRIAIGRDLLARQEKRELKSGQDYSVLRRSVSYAMRDMARAAGVLTRQIGGVRTLRDHAGSGRDPLQPVPAAQQRAALNVLANTFLTADSFRLSPALQRKLALDYQERTDAVFSGDTTAATDFSLASQVIDMQRGVLNQLMSDGVAARLLDSEAKSPKDALRLSELYKRLNQAVWSELAQPGDISSARRELQREYVNRIAGLLLRPSSLSRSDARSLMRSQAQTLHTQIVDALHNKALGAEARAHLQDSADTLAQALSAKLLRAGA